MAEISPPRPFGHTGRYLVAGMLVVAPLWVTYLVFDFILGLLSQTGRPGVYALARFVDPYAPSAAEWLRAPWFESVVAAFLTLAVLYLLGWGTSRVVGRRLLSWFESLLDRIPLVKAIYGSTKTLVRVLQQKPGNAQRVALLAFPSSELRVVALVTRTMKDAATGADLAVVYVPTAPNPTSGYVEIVPLARLTPLDWTVEEAMRFTVTSGASAPDTVPFFAPDRGPAS
ncbi:MAG TPA: DUF502 domain-containing protein [Pelomicrobium sp.]|nr:DUF502 domain-containing protein [Pelomicrobium sp.]